MLILNSDAIDCVNDGRDIPAFLKDEDGVRIIHIKWHSSDAWRGYYEAKATKAGGWSKIDYDGWVTGDWDDAPEEAKGSTVESKLEELADEYQGKGQDVMAVFMPTSNVFSTAFDVFVK